MKRLALVLLVACRSDPTPPPAVALVVPPMPVTSASALQIQDPPPDPPVEAAMPNTSMNPTGAPTPPFDKAAAASALASASLRRCEVPGGPTGVGHATLTWDPSGAVSVVSVDSGPFVGTPVGDCIAKVYSTLTVPRFSGPPVRVGKSFRL